MKIRFMIGFSLEMQLKRSAVIQVPQEIFTSKLDKLTPARYWLCGTDFFAHSLETQKISKKVHFYFFLILVPIIGVEVKGSRRWLNLFFLPRFQPIELVKPFVIIFIATILCIEKNFNIFFKYVISFIAILPIIFLLVIQHDIGQTLLVFLSWAKKDLGVLDLNM